MYNTMEEEMKEFCSKLNLYLVDRYQYKRDPAGPGLGRTIVASRKAFDLYFRYKPYAFWKKDSIVIARIGFNKKRNGNGYSLLKFLINQSKEFDIKHIAIELTHTEAGQNFARKYGFQNIGNKKCWSISIENLSNHLAALSHPAKG